MRSILGRTIQNGIQFEDSIRKKKKGRGVSRGPGFVDFGSLISPFAQSAQGKPITICQNLFASWVGAQKVFELLESSELASP